MTLVATKHRHASVTCGSTLVGLAGVFALAGCGSDGGVVEPPGDDPPTPSVAASVTVAKLTSHLVGDTVSVLGSSVRLVALVRDSGGAVLEGKRVRWTVDPAEAVSIVDFGWAAFMTVLAEGPVEVTASVGSVQGTAVLDVVERARVAWSVTTLGATEGIAIGKDGTIYMAGTVGLQAVGPEGEVRWGLPARVEGTPAIAEDGTLYVGTGEGLMTVDPDGNVLRVTPIDRIGSPPAIGPDGTVYQGTRLGTLYAVDPTGRIRWRFEAPGPEPYRNRSPPAIAEDGTIYFASEDGHLYALDPDGHELWRFQAPGAVREASIGVDGTLYFASDRVASGADGHDILAQARMFALDPDGTERWSAPLEGEAWSGPAIGFDGSIYIATMNHGAQTYVFAPDGALLRKHPPGSNHTPIVAGDGSIYLSGGDLHALDAEGILKWIYEPKNYAGPVPAIGFDGTLYAGASDLTPEHVQYLHAFRELANNGGYHAAPWPQERGDRANTGRALRAP